MSTFFPLKWFDRLTTSGREVVLPIRIENSGEAAALTQLAERDYDSFETRRAALAQRKGILMQMFSSPKATVIIAAAAHVLAWVPGLFLALGPAYSGSSNGGEPDTQTLLEVSGLYGAFVLLVPVLLTGVVLMAVWRGRASEPLLWGIALGLSGLCVLAAGSIGMLYVPAALALVFTAILNAHR